MSFSAKRVVVFDIGGVLAQDVWEHLFLDRNGLCSMYPMVSKKELSTVGRLLWKEFALLPETSTRDWSQLEIMYWEKFIDLLRSKLPKSVVPTDLIRKSIEFIRPIDERMSSLLERIRKNGLILAICSNNNEFWFRRQMSQLDLWRYFDESRIVLSCRVGASKSSRDHKMFHAVVGATNTLPSECLFIDDRKPNIVHAQEFGMEGIEFIDITDLERRISPHIER